MNHTLSYFFLHQSLYFPLRFSEASCETTEPTPTEENYAGLNLGPTMSANDILSENEDSAFESPKKLTSR